MHFAALYGLFVLVNLTDNYARNSIFAGLMPVSIDKLMPNKWTSACAGHIDAGESIIDSALRELNEELGITNLLAADLKFITTLKSSRVTDKIINNHFKYIYFHKTNKKLDELVLQKEEVEEVKYLSIKEVEDIIKNKNEDYLFSNRENINQIIASITENN